MPKKPIFILLIIIGLIAVTVKFLLFPTSQKGSFIEQAINIQIKPSETLKTYSDPTGFSFSYPDNLSLLNNELKADTSYAELQLSAKGVNGSLILKITDSKLASLDEWVKINKTDSSTTKEVKLGNLQALEITTADKLMLGALDQGVLFNLEVPIGKDGDFWAEVLNKVLADFSFVQPVQDGVSASDVSLESEEVIE